MLYEVPPRETFVMQNEFFHQPQLFFVGVVATFVAVTLFGTGKVFNYFRRNSVASLLCRTKLCKTSAPSAHPTQARNHQNKQLSLKIYKCSFHESKAPVSLALFVLLLSSQIKSFSSRRYKSFCLAISVLPSKQIKREKSFFSTSYNEIFVASTAYLPYYGHVRGVFAGRPGVFIGSWF